MTVEFRQAMNDYHFVSTSHSVSNVFDFISQHEYAFVLRFAKSERSDSN